MFLLADRPLGTRKVAFTAAIARFTVIGCHRLPASVSVRSMLPEGPMQHIRLSRLWRLKAPLRQCGYGWVMFEGGVAASGKAPQMEGTC